MQKYDKNCELGRMLDAPDLDSYNSVSFAEKFIEIEPVYTVC